MQATRVMRCRRGEASTAAVQHVRQVRIKKPVFLLISLFLSRSSFGYKQSSMDKKRQRKVSPPEFFFLNHLLLCVSRAKYRWQWRNPDGMEEATNIECLSVHGTHVDLGSINVERMWIRNL